MIFRKSTRLECAWAVVAIALGCAFVQPVASASEARIVVAQTDKPSGEGQINSVNMTHGPVAALKWPGMTMDFPVAPGVDMGALKPGAKVGFTLTKGTDGSYAIDSVKPAR
jgi:Cu/Ag efflux protein CusF